MIMTIEELITELQRVKVTYGNIEVRVTTNNPIDYHKEYVSQDKPTLYPLIWPSTVALDKNNFVVSDKTYDGPDLAYDNTRYLSLGDFSIQGMNNSDIRDIVEKYHARRCGMCDLLQQALKAEENNGTCDFCHFHGPTSQIPYYSEKKYYCSACHYNKPKDNTNGN